jgi:hypothetical protein
MSQQSSNIYYDKLNLCEFYDKLNKSDKANFLKGLTIKEMSLEDKIKLFEFDSGSSPWCPHCNAFVSKLDKCPTTKKYHAYMTDLV